MQSKDVQLPRIKGSLLVWFVKTVRADKSGCYDKWLTDEDRKIVENRVFPSSWYPFDFYERMITGVVKEAAKGDKKVLYDWGILAAADLLRGPYKNLIVKGDTTKTLKKHLQYKDLFFDFGDIRAEYFSDNRVRLRLSGFPKDFEYFYLMFRGWFASILEMTGAKNIKSEFTDMSWMGSADTAIEYNWDEN